jgi:DNA topoisomerase-6 subunit B
MAIKLGPEQAVLFGGTGRGGKSAVAELEEPAKKARTVIRLSTTRAEREKEKAAQAKAARAARRAAAAPAAKPQKNGRNGRAGAKAPPAPETAQTLAAKQREISVSEFFTKNRHLLGFDNPRKALLTAVKEAVDNSLDACDESHILPEITVEIRAVEGVEDRFIVAVTDNGPGIVKQQIGRIFGKLLYGSKFHRLRQSRGQQGIGISAAGMYGQLTTGKPMRITSRTGKDKPAHYLEIHIDTAKNEPQIVKDEERPWEPARGTRVEFELEAKFQRGRQSVDEYLQQTAVANPHAKIVYKAPDGQDLEFPRAARELPPQPREIKPHPYGIELGALMHVLRTTKSRNVSGCLSADFSRISSRTAKLICEKAGIDCKGRPSRIAAQEAERLYQAIQGTKIMNPPTDCLAPIGEESLAAGLQKEFKADFYTAVSRSPAVYRGNPFLVEAALAWGGELPAEELARVLRFANRVPLLYQQGSCAIWESILDTGWKNYHVEQSKGAPPAGPLVICVHFASVWVPFTSESKEAIASYPEIVKETKLALQECGRRLSVFLSKRRRAIEEERKKSYITTYIPHIGIGLRAILGFPEKEEQKVVKQLTNILEKSRGSAE